MVIKYKTINVSKENKELLLKEVKEEYLRHHPEMKDMELSANKLLGELIRWYLPKRLIK